MAADFPEPPLFAMGTSVYAERDGEILLPTRAGTPGGQKSGRRDLRSPRPPPDGTIVADVQLSNRGITQFDVSEEGDQQELLCD